MNFPIDIHIYCNAQLLTLFNNKKKHIMEQQTLKVQLSSTYDAPPSSLMDLVVSPKVKITKEKEMGHAP